MQNGYYYAMVNDVTVECYNPPKGAQGNGDATYMYTDRRGTNDTIEQSSKTVILKSLYASGDKPDYDPEGTGSKPSSAPESIPGVSGAGVRNEDGAASGSEGAPQSQSPQDASGNTGFSQGTNNGGASGSSNGGAAIHPERLGGSVLAILVAVGFMLSC
jgi:hypothetical protein